MSTAVEEDRSEIELKDLVYQSLENEGLISKIKAQLRSAVFKTIEKSATQQGQHHQTSTQLLNSFNTQTGRLCYELLMEWFEHFDLYYTSDIFAVETHHPTQHVSRQELAKKLKLAANDARPLLQALLQHYIDSSPTPTTTTTMSATLPESIQQSINRTFPTEKLNDMKKVREHFYSLYSTFDKEILECYMDKHLTSASVSKYDYEQICLKWFQLCSKTLQTTTIATTTDSKNNPRSNPSPASSTPIMTTTKARRAASPTSDSSSSVSENVSKVSFKLPTTINTKNDSILHINNKNTSNSNKNNLLIDFDEKNKSTSEDEEETSGSLLSKRNATPAALNRLKGMLDDNNNDDDNSTTTGGGTPRVRTKGEDQNIDEVIEYEDESDGGRSSDLGGGIEDITVGKTTPTHSSTNIDYLEDLSEK